MHVRLDSPIHHHPEVSEVAHSLTALASEAEDRNHDAGHLPVLRLDVQFIIVLNQYLIACHGELLAHAVFAPFPVNELTRLFIKHHILVLKRRSDAVGTQRDAPLVQATGLHTECMGSIPRPHQGKTAHNGQHLAFEQLRCIDPKDERLVEIQDVSLLSDIQVVQVAVSRAVHVSPDGQVAPEVANLKRLGIVIPEGTRHTHPALPQHDIPPLDIIIIGNPEGILVLEVQFSCPQDPVRSVQTEFPAYIISFLLLNFELGTN